MHNCMNTSKASLDILFTWAGQHGLKPNVLLECQSRLAKVVSLNLEDFKAVNMSTEKYGGWVGDSHKANIALSPWLYNFLNGKDFQLQPPGKAVPPNRPFTQWTIDNLRHFLYVSQVYQIDVKIEVRGKDPSHSQKSVSWLKKKAWYQKVAENVIQLQEKERSLWPSPLPYLLMDESGDKKTSVRPHFSPDVAVHGREMYDLFPAINQFFSIAMDISINPEPWKCSDIEMSKDLWIRTRNRAEVYAILAVTAFWKVIVRISNKAQTMIRHKACLFGILRSTQHLLDIPWLKSIHESDDIGEGIVKTIRPLVTNGMRYRWYLATMEKFYKNQAMEFFNEVCFGKDGNDLEVSTFLITTKRMQEDRVLTGGPLDDTGEMTIFNADRRFCRYANDDAFIESIQEYDALSLVIYRCCSTQTFKVGFVILSNTVWFVKFLEIDVNTPVLDDGGFAFFEFVATGKTEFRISLPREKMILEEGSFEFICFGLGLPLDGQSRRFAILSGDGRRLNKHFRPTVM